MAICIFTNFASGKQIFFSFFILKKLSNKKQKLNSSSFTDTLLSYYENLHKSICVSNIRWNIINMLDYYIIQSKFLIFLMFDLNFKLIIL